MGLGYEFPAKKADDRAASYGAWVTKYSISQNSLSSWKSSVNGKNPQDKPNPWGPVFKTKQDFLDMHFC